MWTKTYIANLRRSLPGLTPEEAILYFQDAFWLLDQQLLQFAPKKTYEPPILTQPQDSSRLSVPRSSEPSEEHYVPPDSRRKGIHSEKPSPSQPVSEAQTASRRRTSLIPPELKLSMPSAISGLEGKTGGVGLAVPGVTALPAPRELMRSLRPLRRRVDSRHAREFDMEASVNQRAEHNRDAVVWRPIKERWLDVVLVIDRSKSMVLWRDELKEWQLLCQQLGAFRDVRIWSLETESAEAAILRSGPADSPRRPRELLAAGRQRLILLATDCIGPAWFSGRVAEILSIWARYHPVALLHLLSKRLWNRTALRMAEEVCVGASQAAVSNHLLKCLDAWRPIIHQGMHWSPPLPVLTIESDLLHHWACLIRGTLSPELPAVVLPYASSSLAAHPETGKENFGAHNDPDDTQNFLKATQGDITASQRISRFRAASSAQAFQLACLLAAAPLRLPVMRLVQQTMMRNCSQVHLAEFFLGGLIRRTSSLEITDPDYINYDFHQGVRDALMKSPNVSSIVEVQQNVSRYLSSHFGQHLEFGALLTNPESANDENIVKIKGENAEFANVAAQLLRRLGGRYADAVRQLEDIGNRSRAEPTVLPQMTQDEQHAYDAALTKIEECRQKNTEFLDLGRLGLKQWPEELWELVHLTTLNLGRRWHEEGKLRQADSDFAPNSLRENEARWSSLPNLYQLFASDLSWIDLTPLAGLASLQSLECSGNQLSTLEPLARLSSLQSLSCSNNQLSTLEPLAGLASLQSLECSGNRLTTLEPLARLASLQSLSCSNNQLTTLEPMAGLTALQSLDCCSNRLTTLEPLARLSSLQSLECSGNRLTTLEPLAGLASLRDLDCFNNRLSTLEPLAGLSSLQSLNCSGNPITMLEPLAGLSSLQSLSCSNNRLTTLEPLAGLSSLQSLECWNNPIKKLPEKLIWSEFLNSLVLSGTALDGIPVETLSQDDHDNCLERLRSHFRDLKEGEALLPDIKVMVLGNGRIGKTQLCNRLRGLPFEENADSTHGITVASQEFGPDTLLRLWDFGGQDIYHGTHALFMRSRAVFVLVWTPDSENSETHQYNGMTFRNRPLAWWLSYVRHLAGPESPILLVQNRCDRPEDKGPRLPVAPEEVEAFAFCQVLQYSALNQRGRKALEGALEEAIDWLRERQGQVRIGTGRLAVKNRLEALLVEDAAIANSSKRHHRTLSIQQYNQICAECGGVSSPTLLLKYLHLSGIVFHRPGLFGDHIILDQGWALEAVYTVFNRDRCFRYLKQNYGRMTRSVLELLVWQEYSEAEQRLFLDFMLSCGICLIYRQGNEELGIETEYIAPDLLPEYAAVAQEVEARWRDELPFDEAAVELPFPHPGVMRTLLSRIGNLAGMAPVYWRDGICLYESTSRSHARIEQRLLDKPPRIVIRTHVGESLTLLKELTEWVREAAEQSGLRKVFVRLPESVDAKGRAGLESRIPDRESFPSLIFDAMPNSGVTTYAVSYAWRDKSHEIVDRLCKEAEARGVRILRDVTDVGLGERLSKFMTLLAGQDRVFVILSDAYLRSENCMLELSEIWRFCQQDDAKFHERVRVFRLPDALIYDMGYQLDIIEHWQQKYQEAHVRVTALTGRGMLSEAMLRRFSNLNAFARHAGEIVPGIADRLLPKDFEKFMQHGFAY